ncbi:Hexokinase, C-terminal [Kalmanozyma brasiliensis GHG001]|uniref:Phosphotransferase n=1 Tax=Kalmanozyma brasiliensis (strain GHG001) TaxID=1365824 RepID=V5GFH9_KALBG|nr:Hexokinase, C-terminal [Kalmanozyma brasiliensis GHG001]EST04782.1 Hexokinase, C-terminal [Kalmanozyma brasiliensis GHG001]
MPAVPPVSRQQAVQAIEEQFTLDKPLLESLSARFQELYDYGLANHGAEMQMIPSFVTGVPTGTEKGTYLALDLGGTNLRVCEVALDGNGTFTIKQEKYKVSDQLKTGPVNDLFNYMATSIDNFLTDFGTTSTEDVLHLGFTFSFPVEQSAIDRGHLIHWTKGFNCPDAPGKDVVQLLQDALDRKHIKVKCSALVNDTVGALLAHAYAAKGALISAIFGTGTNGAYLEDIRKIKKLKTAEGSISHMVVNTEWGGFDDERKALPVTIFDNKVDRESIRPRNHIFEKMISGMYLGEVARCVLLHLIDQLVLFQGFSSKLLNTQYGFDTAYMSAIEADKEDATSTSSPTRTVLVATMGIKEEHISAEDIETVRTVCRIVGTRAARLSAVAIAATMVQTGNVQSTGPNDDGVKVGMDGSVIEYYPHFEERMRGALRELIGEEGEKRVKIGLAKDGSGVGAALGALQAAKQLASGHRVEV